MVKHYSLHSFCACEKMLALNLFLLYIWLDSKILASEYEDRRRIKELLQELSGSHLNFSATHIPPFLSIKKESNGSFSYQGLHVNICEFLITHPLNITYSFVNARVDEEDAVGLKEAAVNLLMRDEVDVVTYGLGLSVDHCSRMDCSVPLTMSPYALMVPWPGEESHLLAPIKPFQPMVWTLFCIIFITITFVLVIIPKFYSKFIESRQQENCVENTRSTINSATNILTILTNHGSWVGYKQLSFRIALASWCLGSFILANTYSSALISYIVAPKLQPVSKSFEDIASGYPQPLKLLTEKNSLLPTYYFLNAKSGTYKLIGDSLRENPETLFTNRQKGSQLMDTGHYAYAAFEQLAYAFMDEGNKRAGYCRFTISNKNLPISPGYPVYAFHKNWRYSDAINYRMQLGWESGLLQHWIKSSEKNIDKCLLNHNRDNRKPMSNNKQNKNLSLINLSGPFVILLFGLSLSFFVFLVELMWHRFKYHRQVLNAQKSVKDKSNEVHEGKKPCSEESISEKDVGETIPGGKESHSKETVSIVGIGEIPEEPQLSSEETKNSALYNGQYRHNENFISKAGHTYWF